MRELLAKFDRLPEPDKRPAAIASYKAHVESSFFDFAKHTLGYKDLRWDVHHEAVRVLESAATRKFLILPRGAFKSTLVSVAYPIWRLAKDPNLTIMLDSEVYTNSKNFLREIRSHLRSNELLRTVWGPWIGPIDNEGEVTIAQRTRNRKEASLTAAGIETVKVGQHFDICLGDDYNSPKNSDTPEKCRKVIDHVRYNLNILNPGGEYAFAATRYAEIDVPGFFLKEILGEKHLADGKLTLAGPENILENDLNRALEF